MSDYEIECYECGWAGTPGELHCSPEDAKSNKPVGEIEFNRCPNCGEVDCFTELEEEDQ